MLVQINLHPDWINVFPGIFLFLLQLIFRVEFDYIHPRPYVAQFVLLHNGEQFGDNGLLAQLHCLQAFEVPYVPNFNAARIVRRNYHWRFLYDCDCGNH